MIKMKALRFFSFHEWALAVKFTIFFSFFTLQFAKSFNPLFLNEFRYLTASKTHFSNFQDIHNWPQSSVKKNWHLSCGNPNDALDIIVPLGTLKLVSYFEKWDWEAGCQDKSRCHCVVIRSHDFWISRTKEIFSKKNYFE